MVDRDVIPLAVGSWIGGIGSGLIHPILMPIGAYLGIVSAGVLYERVTAEAEETER